MAREHEPRLLRAALRFCSHNADQAQDLVQDTLIRAYEACLKDQYRDQGNVRAWMLRIMTNLFLNQNRRDTRWSADVTAEEVIEQGGGACALAAESPEQTLLSGTLDETLERALAALPEEQRLCILLVDVEGLEYAEAASALGAPIGSVRSRLARGRLKLHALLQDFARERRLVHG